MYVKASTRRTREGQVIRYLQLAHNEWDPDAGVSRTKVLYSFGREDRIDRAAIERLVAALSKLLDSDATTLPSARDDDWTFTASRPMGGSFLLDQLWRRLGIDTAISKALTAGKRDPKAVERVLFALTANRALAASSKLAATEWIEHDTHIDGLHEISDDACYRAMDALHDIEPVLAKQVYFQVTDLLNLEVDLLFFDTTSTYFETGEADEPVARDTDGRPVDPHDPQAQTVSEDGFRSYGKSKDSRNDLPQVVVGMAVTRDGIPVRCWSWPGNTADSALIRQVKDDMREWSLSQIVWVADRGFSSKENRRALMAGAGGYIIGEKLRSDSPDIKAALSRQGRYATVRHNMQVKEVKVGTADRLVICFNPAQAERDAAVRSELLARLDKAIAGTDTLSTVKRAELRGKLSTKPGLNRFLRVTPGGLLRIDKQRIATEANLDGKYLLRCSDPHLSAEDIALGYKQLLEVERGWRDMKQIIDLRPVYHRREDRIRAHVLLCWLALLLIRIAENATKQPWPQIRREMQRVQLGTFTGPAGTFRKRTDLTSSQKTILSALTLTDPPRIFDAEPTTG